LSRRLCQQMDGNYVCLWFVSIVLLVPNDFAYQPSPQAIT
jgi:hypothetical protein